MIAQHTPGPWTINTADTGMNDSGTIEGGGVVICPDVYGESLSRVNANAQLIIAAPDMLEALKGLFEHCAMVHKHWGAGNNAQQAQEAIDKARAAMAKAEGKP